MRHRRWPRVSAYQDTPRKRAALARSQQHQHDRLPLLAPLIAEAQPDPEIEMARRGATWPEQQQHDRDRRAHDWRCARAKLAAHAQATRRVIAKLWRESPYPAEPTYLLELLHAVETDRIDPECPPWRYDGQTPIGQTPTSARSRRKRPCSAACSARPA